MASGFGVDATVNASTGEVLSSTTSQDIRRIMGSLYSPGVISGGVVTTSASGLTYSVSAGVAAIQTATGQIVLTPFDSATATSVGTAARTDIIYVKQNFPADGNSNAVVGLNNTLPKNALALARFSVPAGATNTNAAIRQGNTDYAIPYGASLGALWTYTDTRNATLPNALERRGQGKIYLPTDRRIRFNIQTTLSASGAVGFDSSKYCEWAFWPMIDNSFPTKWTTPGLHQAWCTWQWEYEMNVVAGEHVVSYQTGREVGPGTAKQHYGFDVTNNMRTGTVFTVEDVGVVK